MSFTTQTTLWCDNAECPWFIQIDTPLVTAARAEAAGVGWTYTKRADYCPKHRKDEA